MKFNLTFLTLFFLLFSNSLSAQQKQGLKIEGSIGIVIGDSNINDASVFGFGVDLTYLFNVHGSFQLGPTIGYHNYFGKKSSQPAALNTSLGNDLQILPLAVSSRYYLFDEFFIGTDLGYGLFIDDFLKDESGFYLKPKVGFNFDGVGVHLAYTNIFGDVVNFSSINLGIEFSF